MATLGCHSCGIDIEQYKGKPYEQTPCATCSMGKEYSRTFRTALFDSSKDPDNDESLATFDTYTDDDSDLHYDLESDDITIGINSLSAKQLDLIKTVIENQLLTTLSGLILKLLKMAQKYPLMFELTIKKLQYPHMSYTELGSSVSPICKKQNVLYHLRHAVELIPELGSALITDTRFSAGHYSLRTLSQALQKIKNTKTLENTLYDPQDKRFKALRISEINKIINSPVMFSEDLFNFNPYIKDEFDDVQTTSINNYDKDKR